MMTTTVQVCGQVLRVADTRDTHQGLRMAVPIPAKRRLDATVDSTQPYRRDGGRPCAPNGPLLV